MLPADISQRFFNWFFNYANTYYNPRLVPPNFLKLNDLDADNIIHETLFDRPEDEFDLSTARGQISRFMTDTDRSPTGPVMASAPPRTRPVVASNGAR